jgi:hypothetical protein
VVDDRSLSHRKDRSIANPFLTDEIDRTQPAPRKHPDGNDRSPNWTDDRPTRRTSTGDTLTIVGVLGLAIDHSWANGGDRSHFLTELTIAFRTSELSEFLNFHQSVEFSN